LLHLAIAAAYQRATLTSRALTVRYPRLVATRLAAATRTGVAVPKDVAIYGTTEVFHFDKEIVVQSWLPGVERTDLSCGFYSIGANKAPMLIMQAPKNNLVKKWERDNFSTRFRQSRETKYDWLQRAVCLNQNVSLYETTADYGGGSLTIRVPKASAPAPSDSLPLSITIEEGTGDPVLREPSEDEFDNWEFIWYKHGKYDPARAMTEENIRKAGINPLSGNITTAPGALTSDGQRHKIGEALKQVRAWGWTTRYDKRP